MHTHTHKALIEKTPRNATAMAQASTCGVSCCFYYPAPLVTPAASLHGVHSITFPTVPGAKRLGLTSLQKQNSHPEWQQTVIVPHTNIPFFWKTCAANLMTTRRSSHSVHQHHHPYSAPTLLGWLWLQAAEAESLKNIYELGLRAPSHIRTIGVDCNWSAGGAWEFDGGIVKCCIV